ncbi:MAG: NADAR family protein [Firmicutes bacterium]|nr:NADAR family protein [Bacillota bacterium]
MPQVICFDNYDQENIEFSNWYLADFIVDSRKFTSVEQYMMYEKALLFRDAEIAEKVLDVHDAAEIKALGRQVNNYNEQDWNGIRQIVVYRGNLEKFRQNPDLAAKLSATGDAMLAECEPSDKIWGIGMALDDERRHDPKAWQGQNLLGYTLMMVRKSL